jgi:predicted pyridoxine 5'-phosphate oxidase superfamily flavin-nucleotide-binding protein
MIPEKLREVLKQDGVVAIATLGQDGPHMVNTWNSYIRISEDGRILIPAGYMHRTEANIAFNNNVLITLGSSKVTGNHGPGAGFLIKGTAAFISEGPDFDLLKSKFEWLRATLAVTADSVTQTW